MAGTDIKVEQVGIGTALRNFWLRVPKHQREYSWDGDEHVTPLFKDYSAALRDDPNGPYFLGTIVTVREDVDQLLVVDGQQRLATTSLLLAAMRQYLISQDVLKRAQAIERLLWEVDADVQDEVPKLTLNAQDAGLYLDIIRGVAPPKAPSALVSNKKLITARDLAIEHVAKIVSVLPQVEHSNEINRWLKFIVERVEIVLLIVPDRRSAFRMFQTLNDRGLTASKADLIKSHLFEMAGGREAEVARAWSNMRLAIESAVPTDEDATLDFLRYALIVQRGHLREAETFERVRRMVDSEATAASEAAALEALASAFVSTTNPYHERWAKYPTAMRRALTEYAVLDVKPMRPLVMAVGATMAPKEAAESLSFLVSLAVRLNIASSTRSSTVEEPLGNVAAQVYEGRVDTASKLREALAHITPTNPAFQEEFARAHVNNGKLARYYLRTLEDAHNGIRDAHLTPVDDSERFDLEHVLPRKPEPGWSVTEDVIAQYSTRLGNLVLLKKVDNSRLRSKPFAEKIPAFSRSYALTQMVTREKDWTPAAIERRQAALAELAVKAWPIKPLVKPTPPRVPRHRKSQPEDVAEIAFRTRTESTGE